MPPPRVAPPPVPAPPVPAPPAPLHEEVQRAGQTPVLRFGGAAILLVALVVAAALRGSAASAVLLVPVLALWAAARMGYRVRVGREALEVAWLWPWQGDGHRKRGRRWAWGEVTRVWRERDAPTGHTLRVLLDPYHLFTRFDVVGFWHRDHVVVEARRRRPLKVGTRDPQVLLDAVARSRGRGTDAPPGRPAAAAAGAPGTDPDADHSDAS